MTACSFNMLSSPLSPTEDYSYIDSILFLYYGVFSLQVYNIDMKRDNKNGVAGFRPQLHYLYIRKKVIVLVTKVTEIPNPLVAGYGHQDNFLNKHPDDKETYSSKQLRRIETPVIDPFSLFALREDLLMNW